MKRSRSSPPSPALSVLAGAALLAGACFLPPAPAAAGSAQPACRTPEEALRRYVNAVNAGNFDGEYALFAAVERGSAPQPIPLLPKATLHDLLASGRRALPRGLRLGAHPLQTMRTFAVGQPGEVAGFLVPVLDPGRPAPPPGRYCGTYVVAVQPTPAGWKVRAWATYWMYFERAYGHAAGTRFRESYEREAESLHLIQRPQRISQTASSR